MSYSNGRPERIFVHNPNPGRDKGKEKGKGNQVKGQGRGKGGRGKGKQNPPQWQGTVPAWTPRGTRWCTTP